MTLEQIFSVSSALALSGWIALAFARFMPRVALLYAGRIVPLVLACLYAALILANVAGAQGGFSSLAGVALLFQTPQLLLAGWIHYLAFDLFIGAWQVGEAQRRGIGLLPLLACLVLTFLFGPVGLMLFLFLSAANRLAPSTAGAPLHV